MKVEHKTLIMSMVLCIISLLGLSWSVLIPDNGELYIPSIKLFGLFCGFGVFPVSLVIFLMTVDYVAPRKQYKSR